MESRKRSIVKAITFRLIATLTTIFIILLFTKDWNMAGIIGGIDLVSKLIVYYIHERIWNKTKWGMDIQKVTPS